MKIFFRLNFLGGVFFGLLSFVGCGSDEPAGPDEPETFHIKDLKYNTKESSKVIANYITLSSESATQTEPAVWDFGMGGTFACYLNANTMQEGRLNYIDKPFAEVDEGCLIKHFGGVETFLSNFKNLENFGLNKSALDGNKDGWLNYNLTAHIGVPVKDRTLLLMSTDQDGAFVLYKIQMISVYQGAPENPTKESETGYLTFNYSKIALDKISLK